MCWYDGLRWVCKLVGRVRLGEEKVTHVHLCMIGPTAAAGPLRRAVTISADLRRPGTWGPA